jgi:hypothetical protein
VRSAGAASILGLGLLALLACSRPAATPTPAADAPPVTFTAVRVTDLEIGRTIGPDKRVTDETDSFKPRDTIYLSVATDGASPAANLRARWTYGAGQLVDETSQSIAPSGPSVTEFHLAKPDGWPAGSYRVEVFLDGTSAGSKEFKVD